MASGYLHFTNSTKTKLMNRVKESMDWKNFWREKKWAHEKNWKNIHTSYEYNTWIPNCIIIKALKNFFGKTNIKKVNDKNKWQNYEEKKILIRKIHEGIQRRHIYEDKQD